MQAADPEEADEWIAAIERRAVVVPVPAAVVSAPTAPEGELSAAEEHKSGKGSGRHSLLSRSSRGSRCSGSEGSSSGGGGAGGIKGSFRFSKSMRDTRSASAVEDTEAEMATAAVAATASNAARRMAARQLQAEAACRDGGDAQDGGSAQGTGGGSGGSSAGGGGGGGGVGGGVGRTMCGWVWKPAAMSKGQWRRRWCELRGPELWQVDSPSSGSSASISGRMLLDLRGVLAQEVVFPPGQALLHRPSILLVRHDGAPLRPKAGKETSLTLGLESQEEADRWLLACQVRLAWPSGRPVVGHPFSAAPLISVRQPSLPHPSRRIPPRTSLMPQDASRGLALIETPQMMLRERLADRATIYGEAGGEAGAKAGGEGGGEAGGGGSEQSVLSGALAVLGRHEGQGLKLIKVVSSKSAQKAASSLPDTAGVMAWQMRWVILGGGRLRAYPSIRTGGERSAVGAPSEVYSLRDLSEVSPLPEHGDRCFTVRLLHERDGLPHTLHLKAPSSQQRDLWIAAVLEAALLATVGAEMADDDLADEAAHQPLPRHTSDAAAAAPPPTRDRRPSLRTSLVVAPGTLLLERASWDRSEQEGGAEARTLAAAALATAARPRRRTALVRRWLTCGCCVPAAAELMGIELQERDQPPHNSLPEATDIHRSGHAATGGGGGRLLAGGDDASGAGGANERVGPTRAEIAAEIAGLPVSASIASGARKGGKGGLKWRCEVSIGAVDGGEAGGAASAEEEGAPLVLKLSHTWAQAVLKLKVRQEPLSRAPTRHDTTRHDSSSTRLDSTRLDSTRLHSTPLDLTSLDFTRLHSTRLDCEWL